MQALRLLIELLVIVGFLPLSVATISVVFRPIWNAVMPELFGFKPLTRKQAWNLLSIVAQLVICSYVVVLCLNGILKALPKLFW